MRADVSATSLMTVATPALWFLSHENLPLLACDIGALARALAN